MSFIRNETESRSLKQVELYMIISGWQWVGFGSRLPGPRPIYFFGPGPRPIADQLGQEVGIQTLTL